MSLQRPRAEDPYAKLPATGRFEVSSNEVSDGAPLPARHSLSGGDASPHLSWSGAPAGTRSYAVTCFDPDAPTPSGFWHWVAVNLPANTSELATNAGREGGSGLPKGAFQVRNDYGKRAYGGAAPPKGEEHRYYFVVHAVDTEKLGVDENASPAVVSFHLASHTLARAILVSTFRG